MQLRSGLGRVARVLGANPLRTPPPASFKLAAERLADPAVMRSVEHRSKLVSLDYQGAHPDILLFIRRFMKAAAERQWPLYPLEAFRSHESQYRLFKHCATANKPGHSPHNFGCAVDVVHTTRYTDLTHEEWGVIATLGKESARKCQVKIEWGGDLAGENPAHWQLAKWRDRAAELPDQA